MKILPRFINERGHVKTRADAADRTSKHVIEEERRDREFGGWASHCLTDNFVHAAANEHAAAFDVYGAHGIRKQHDRQNEPRRRLADRFLGNAANVISRRTEI